jgi:capsule biosynthesis phosphatase
MKRILLDLDHTICVAKDERSDDIHRKYENAEPVEHVIAKIRAYKQMGFKISIYTSRNMRSFGENTDLIRQHTLPRIERWLESHNVEFDDVIIGKPWCGQGGFYVDDKAIRPSEFSRLAYNEVVNLLSEESTCLQRQPSL